MRLYVRVFGRPAPQGSHEQGANGYLMHSSNYLHAWRAAVDRATREAYLAAGLTKQDMPLIPNPWPAYVEITHWMQDDQCRAAGTDEPTGAPDGDKLLRATVDGLAAARVFANDSQIIDHITRKRRGKAPGAEIIISDRPLDTRPEGESPMDQKRPEYRLNLQRITGVDESGFAEGVTVFELLDSGAIVASVGVATLAALLGAGSVSVTPTPPSTEAPEAPAPKPTRGRKPKTETPAEPAQVAAAPPAEVPAPTPAPELAPAPQATAQPARVNPFAR